MIYLASPYSHEDPAVREQRYREAAAYVAASIHEGLAVFSPIVYTHNWYEEHGFGFEAWQWITFNEHMMKACDRIVVLRSEGFEKSTGVRAEIRYFVDRGISVLYCNPGEVLHEEDIYG